jgi:hypothetical protein
MWAPRRTGESTKVVRETGLNSVVSLSPVPGRATGSAVASFQPAGRRRLAFTVTSSVATPCG